MVKNMSVINEFLKDFSHATQKSYKSALKKYFETIQKNPDNYFKNGQRKYSEKELLVYEQDVKLFWQRIKDNPPHTVKQYLGVVRVFLQDNYIDIPNKFWKDFRKRKKGSRTLIRDIVPTREQFKQLISHGNLLEKAIVTTLLSSGMRIGELVSIKEEDVNLNFKPVKIEIQGEYTKTGNPRTVFISNEAGGFLREWLKEINNDKGEKTTLKQEYLNRAVKILNIPQINKKIVDNRVFPMHSGVARQKWNRLLRKSGLTEKDNSTSRLQYKIHPHVTRKYFRTWMAKDLGRDLTEYFLGHEEGLDAIYRRYGDDSNKRMLGDEYCKGMHNVSVFEIELDLTETRKEMEEIKQENKALKQEMDRIRMELLEVKMKQVQELQKKKL